MQTVGDVMSAAVITVEAQQRLDEAIRTMAELAISCVVVVSGDEPVGVVSERDLVRRVLAPAADPGTLLVADVMTKGVVSATADVTTLDALHLLRGRGFRRLPVVDAHGALIGVATQTDLLRGLLDYLRRFTLQDLLQRVMEMEGSFVRQNVALHTVTSRHRLLDLRCSELLQALHRSLRDLNGPLADAGLAASELEAAARGLETLLGTGRDDDPANVETVRRAEQMLRRAGTETGAWLAEVTTRLERADDVIASLLDRDIVPDGGDGRGAPPPR